MKEVQYADGEESELEHEVEDPDYVEPSIDAPTGGDITPVLSKSNQPETLEAVLPPSPPQSVPQEDREVAGQAYVSASRDLEQEERIYRSVIAGSNSEAPRQMASAGTELRRAVIQDIRPDPLMGHRDLIDSDLDGHGSMNKYETQSPEDTARARRKLPWER